MITRIEKYAEKNNLMQIMDPTIFHQITSDYQYTYPNLCGHRFDR